MEFESLNLVERQKINSDLNTTSTRYCRLHRLENCLKKLSIIKTFKDNLQSWVNDEKQNHPENNQNINTAQQRILKAFETEATLLDLSDLNLYSLPYCIGQLSALTELNVYNNQLVSLPESIRQLSALTKLYVFDNKLTSLTESIGDLTNLTSLYVE